MNTIKDTTKNISDGISHLNHFIAGEIAGMVAAIVSHPFDTVKTRLQVEMISDSMRRTHNTWTMLQHMFITDGVKNVYKGIIPPFFGYGLSSSVIFGVNNLSRNFLIKHRNNKNHHKPKQLSLSDLAICGGITGFFNTFVVTPLERIKIWSQSHKTHAFISVKSLYKQMGIFTGYFGGMKYTFAFQMLTYAFYFPVYEITLKGLTMERNINTKQWYSNHIIGDMTCKNKKEISSWKIGVAGGMAGIISWIVGYPIDTLKTRVQSGFYSDEVSIHALKRHYSVSLYGIAPAIYRAAVLHSCVFLMYERTLQVANEYNMVY